MRDLNSSLIVFGQPYRLTEGRIVHLRSGYVRIRANLHDLTIKAHQMVVASPGTVAEFVEMSPDCELSMVGIANSFMEGWQKEEQLMAYLQGRLYLWLSLNEDGWRLFFLCCGKWYMMFLFLKVRCKV